MSIHWQTAPGARKFKSRTYKPGEFEAEDKARRAYLLRYLDRMASEERLIRGDQFSGSWRVKKRR